MKNIIKNILREDFEWANDIPSHDDMHIDWVDDVLPYLTGRRPTYDDDNDMLEYDEWEEISNSERQELEPLVKHYFVRELGDVEFKDGKFIISVGSWEEFAPMFKACDYQGYICKDTAEAILDEDDNWEAYHDVVNDWVEQVWESVSDKSYQTIVKHIRKWLIGDILNMDGEEVELTEELLTSWLGEKSILGQIINEEPGSGFEDLKGTMTWAYEGAYSDASRDDYWVATYDAITGVVGEGDWGSREINRVDGTTTTTITDHYLEFDVTDIFMDVIQTYFDDYADLDYDHTIEMEYNYFLNNLILLMGEEIYGELLNPRVSEWPDTHKVSEYMNERINEDLS